MKSNVKISNDYKFGFSSAKKKLGINTWRFVFNGVNKSTGAEQMFYIEFEMLNPWNSADAVQLGFKPRVNISAEDLRRILPEDLPVVKKVQSVEEILSMLDDLIGMESVKKAVRELCQTIQNNLRRKVACLSICSSVNCLAIINI